MPDPKTTVKWNCFKQIDIGDWNCRIFRRVTRAKLFLTRVRCPPYPWGMEVHLPQNQEVQLKELAAQTGRGTDDLLQEAVAKLLAHNEWFKAQVQIGIDQIARGEFIEEEEMDARVERMLQP